MVIMAYRSHKARVAEIPGRMRLGRQSRACLFLFDLNHLAALVLPTVRTRAVRKHLLVTVGAFR